VIRELNFMMKRRTAMEIEVKIMVKPVAKLKAAPGFL
jgi:hypothetical protein